MNIATVSTLDPVWKEALRRWVFMIKKHMPEAKLYLAVPEGEPLTCLEKAKRYFADIRIIKMPKLSGRLLTYDAARAGLPGLFKLNELLYIDPDADVVAPLDDMPGIRPEASLMLTPAPIETQGIRAEIERALGKKWTHKLCDIGFMYMRKDFFADFMAVFRRCGIDQNCFAPGMAAWNILAREADAHVLPFEYHQSWWAMEKLTHVRVIHFSGNYSKRVRPFLRYGYAGPGSIDLVREPYDMSSIDF